MHVTSSNTRNRAWTEITTNLSWASQKTELWCHFPPASTKYLIKQNDEHSTGKCNEAVQHHLSNSAMELQAIACFFCSSKCDHYLVSMNIVLAYIWYKKWLKASVLTKEMIARIKGWGGGNSCWLHTFQDLRTGPTLTMFMQLFSNKTMYYIDDHQYGVCRWICRAPLVSL